MQVFIACIFSKCCFENISVELFALATHPSLCVLLPVFLQKLCRIKAFLLNTCITCLSQVSHLVCIIQKFNFAANLFLFGSLNNPFVKALNKHFLLPRGYTEGFPQSHLIFFLKTVSDHTAWKEIKSRDFLGCDTVFHAVTALLSCSLLLYPDFLITETIPRYTGLSKRGNKRWGPCEPNHMQGNHSPCCSKSIN